jgi:aminoglycoside phosphotransferase
MRRVVDDTHRAAIGWAQSIMNEPRLTVEIASGTDRATTYRLSDGDVVLAYLKIGVYSLAGERDRLIWLRERVLVPDVLGFATSDRQDWLLTAPLRGADLSRPEHTAYPHRLIQLLASALKGLHSLDSARCPFGRAEGDAVIVHGDACLPNFVFDGTNFMGCLDVGDLRLGSPEVDLAAAVWSLDHNLGHGFGGEFLRTYGWPEHDEATVAQLRLSYETVP